MSQVVPYIPPEKNLPEITIKGVILGVVLSIVLGGAVAYLGLRVGLTVSASIPAAVISMGLLRFFPRRNILENNAVQTAASAGESLAAGVIFTIPALLILDYWTEIQYLETTLIALVGGVLGVFFTVPLRQALIVEAQLTFPEGIATSEVLKAGEGGKDTGLIALAIGAVSGALYKFGESALRLWSPEANYGARFQDGAAAFGATLSPALLAVGYIVGLHIASLVFIGGVMGWLVAIPLYSAFASDAASLTAGLSGYDGAATLWSTRIRYIGVGAMLVGGLWSLIKLRKPLGSAMRAGLGAADDDQTETLRTEQGLSLRVTYSAIAILTLPLAGLYWAATGNVLVAALLAVLMLVAGFFFSAVGAYMAGLVGSSNNPISGVTILTVMAASLLLVALGVDVEVGPAAAILVAAVIASAGAIASDNMQDLKAGYLLGATPKRQQVMQIIGVTAGAVTIALVVRLLTQAYELGSADLAAPQASLMAAVAQGIFGVADLPMNMVYIGIAAAIAILIVDELLAKSRFHFRAPIMPIAVGIYLPVGLSVPIFVGGLVAWTIARKWRHDPEEKESANRQGVLLGSGLIAGEALLGIFIAAMVAIEVDGSSLITRLYLSDGALQWPGLVLMGYLVILLGYFGMRRRWVNS